ncbi:MAG TPA: MFS transporter, partial [Chloroflexota bacterium]|nr:MFS transporter [Chloroflexota bacterium]
LTVAHPLIELRVFRSRDFTLSILTQWLLFGAVFGSFFLLPVFLQQVRGYGALDTGLATLPQALVAAVFMPIGGRLFDRIGARPLVATGLVLASTALWLLSRISGATTAADLRLPLGVMGAGMGLMMMPLGTHLLNAAPRHLVSRVTSLTGALQNVVASLAIASYATFLQGRITTAMTALRAAAPQGVAAGGAAAGAAGAAGGAPAAAAGAASAGAAAAREGFGAAQAAGAQLPPQVAEIFAHAFGDTYRVAMFIALAAILFALTLRRRPAAASQAAPAAHAEPVMAAG